MYDVPNITDITTEQFDRTIKTNVSGWSSWAVIRSHITKIYGTFFLTRAAVPHIPQGGSSKYAPSEMMLLPSLLCANNIDNSYYDLFSSRVLWPTFASRLCHD